MTDVTTSLSAATTGAVMDRLASANRAHGERYPGATGARQPLHTVYGGAHLFKAPTTNKLGAIALRALDAYAPDFASLAHALELPGYEQVPAAGPELDALAARLEADPEAVRAALPGAWLAWAVRQRVHDKLAREPVEDFRIDFEDGYGNRTDAEEDADADRTAREVARGMAEGLLPPFIGIRVKPFTEELKRRGVRTLDIFLTTLAGETGGRLPGHFVVTLPKVTIPEQVTALADLFDALEPALDIEAGALKIELMIEEPQAILNHRGESTLPLLVSAARGRCRGAHFGTYDYTASCSITAAWQAMDHPVSDFAKHMMLVALSGTGVMLSDGATVVMPVAPHRGKELTPAQGAENRAAVVSAWKLAYDNARHSLIHGFYQGWDLHPAQLVTRYAACFAFFLEGLEQASKRLSSFVDRAAQATLHGNTFDDAATGQGLLNFFLKALNSGAITLDEVRATGLSLAEVQSKSFVRIVEARRDAAS